MNVAMVAGVTLVLMLIRQHRPSVPFAVVLGGAGLVIDAPLTVLGGAVWAAAVLLRQHRHRKVRDARADGDVSLTAQMLLISLSAGLPLPAALRVASERVGPTMQAELAELLRSGAHIGMAEALRNHEGRLGRLTLLLARAQVTGASISAAVQSFVTERRDEERASGLEAARRLPVKLTIPLALLILPGFVVLTVGPSVLDSARRLLGPVVPVP